MTYKNKLLVSVAALGTSLIASGAMADVCDTPTALSGDLGSFDGEVVTVMGSMQGRDEENLLAMASCFEQATGAVVKYSGSRDFAALIVADLRSNNAPNIAIFPQPGLAGDMAKEGHLVPLGGGSAE